MRKPAEPRRAASIPVEAPGNPGARLPIGKVADLLGVTEQTLRLYEAQGLVKPARRNRERHYNAGDVRWLECLRHLIHAEKVSIQGIKRLLHFAPCWEIVGFQGGVPCGRCPVFRKRAGGPVMSGTIRRGSPAPAAGGSG